MAEEADDLCPDRPGLGTPTCTVPPGGIVGELGIAAWERDGDAISRTDTIMAGEMLLRLGLAEGLEAQVGWDAYGHVRTRDLESGTTDRIARVGDLTLALRHTLHDPGERGFSMAVMPYATVPTGRMPIGAGDWGAGLLLPLALTLTENVSLSATPQIDAAVDSDGSGRHLAFGSVLGLDFALGNRLGAATEISLYRDRDPEGHDTIILAGFSAAWQPNDAMQFDLGVNIGLNSASPDSQVYFGIARRF
ncbi:MAG: transporter [Novosphingobium sp.]